MSTKDNHSQGPDDPRPEDTRPDAHPQPEQPADPAIDPAEQPEDPRPDAHPQPEQPADPAEQPADPASDPAIDPAEIATTAFNAQTPPPPQASNVDRSDIDRIQNILGQRYQLQWIIGHGGMSTVWLATDTEHPDRRDVAIKILRPEYTENTEFRTRFRNEAEASKHLDSPNVVATYDYGEIHEQSAYKGIVFCYIVMEYVKGEALADVLARQQTLPEKLVADLLAQAAMGLEEIHSSGMVHRDIKPGNLLITSDGIVKVTDFGIAKAAEAVPLTRTGMVIGTAQYVSPEQAQGLAVAPASDVYSLGVVGYECLAGRRPFTGDSTVSVALKHISEAPAPLPDTISPAMREFIGICLRKDPQARYADGSEMASAIAVVATGGTPPQPHHVPISPDAPAHAYTNQLGDVATGPGTRVPPMQGPGFAAGAAAGAVAAGALGASGAHAAAGPGAGGGAGGAAGYGSGAHSAGGAGAAGAGAGGAGAHSAGGPGAAGAGAGGAVRTGAGTNARKKDSNVPLAITGLLAALAVGVAGYLFVTNSSDDPQDNRPATTTITNEVTATQESPSTTQEPSTIIITTETAPTTGENTEPSDQDEQTPTTHRTTRTSRPHQPIETQPEQPTQPAEPTGGTQTIQPTQPADPTGGEQPTEDPLEWLNNLG